MENIKRRPVLEHLTFSGKFWVLILLFVFCLSIFSLLAAAVMIPFAGIHDLSDLSKINDYNNPNVLVGLKVAQTISAIGSFVLPSFVFAFLVSSNSTGYLKLNVSLKLKSLVIVFLVMISVLPFINWLGELNSKMVLPDFLSDVEQWMKTYEEQAKQLTEAFLKMNGIGDLIINLFVIAFLAAFSEELLFRGVIQKLLMDWKKNTHFAIWITAIIFSAFHVQFYGFIPRMILGALMGYLFQWSGSIWLSVFAHFVNNAFAVVVEYMTSKNIISPEVESVGEGGNTILVASSVLITLFFLTMVYRFEKSKNLESFNL